MEPNQEPTTLQMTEAEVMRLENLSLRIEVIQTNAQRDAAPFIAAREQLGRVIGERLGIDPSCYVFNIETGSVVPRPVAPAGEQAEGTATDPT